MTASFANARGLSTNQARSESGQISSRNEVGKSPIGPINGYPYQNTPPQKRQNISDEMMFLRFGFPNQDFTHLA